MYKALNKHSTAIIIKRTLKPKKVTINPPKNAPELVKVRFLKPGS